jgi:hypothetical protein
MRTPLVASATLFVDSSVFAGRDGGIAGGVVDRTGEVDVSVGASVDLTRDADGSSGRSMDRRPKSATVSGDSGVLADEVPDCIGEVECPHGCGP